MSTAPNTVDRVVDVPASAPSECSADFACVRVGFDLSQDGLPLKNDDDDAAVDALFELSGKGWEADSYNGSSICGTFFVVKFDHVPTRAAVKAVRRKIVAVLNSQNTNYPT